MPHTHAVWLYPRPDFQRELLRWDPLSGSGWEIAFDDDDVGVTNLWYQPFRRIPKEKTRSINVPFVYQSPASGIDEHEAHAIVWYQANIFAPTPYPPYVLPGRNLLRFGAVDYEMTVWLGGKYLGKHRGGHVPFEFDISYMADEREPTLLSIRVWDASTDLTQPRGKQYWGPKPEGIFYTPSTGIWQQVWIERVPDVCIADSSHGTVIRSHDIETGEIGAEIAVDGRRKGTFQIILKASLAGVDVATSEPAEVNAETGIAKLKMCLRLSDEQQSKLQQDFTEAHPLSDKTCWHNKVALWSPEHPILYDLTIILHRDKDDVLDKIKTTVGMRSLSWNNNDGTFRLNNQPYFQALVLDQGYWPSTLMTPPTGESCRDDILLAKKMGFNGCRKHQKVEDPLFLYWADKLGYLVWGEMANAYEFSNQYVDRFDQEWKEAVRRDINHPCIVAWTPINETWGYKNLANSPEEQNHIKALYHTTKTLDPTRPINDNCGWEHVCTDLTTFHDYNDGPQLADICSNMERILDKKAGKGMFVGGASHSQGAPVICTEFGGVNIAAKEGEKAVENSWGYTTASDAQDLLERVRRLMLGVVQGGHCCGFVYTQL